MAPPPPPEEEEEEALHEIIKGRHNKRGQVVACLNSLSVRLVGRFYFISRRKDGGGGGGE